MVSCTLADALAPSSAVSPVDAKASDVTGGMPKRALTVPPSASVQYTPPRPSVARPLGTRIEDARPPAMGTDDPPVLGARAIVSWPIQ